METVKEATKNNSVEHCWYVNTISVLRNNCYNAFFTEEKQDKTFVIADIIYQWKFSGRFNSVNSALVSFINRPSLDCSDSIFALHTKYKHEIKLGWYCVRKLARKLRRWMFILPILNLRGSTRRKCKCHEITYGAGSKVPNIIKSTLILSKMEY